MHDYSKTHGFAVEVNMADPANGGNPTIMGFVVPKDRPEGSFDGRVDLVRVEFGHSDSDASSLTFFLPDGEQFKQLSLDGAEGDENERINRPLNLAWTGDKDSHFMHHVANCLAKTCLMVCTASAMKAQAGVPYSDTIDAMVSHAAEMRGYEQQDDGTLKPIGLSEEVPND